jgi:hypothetical protein
MKIMRRAIIGALTVAATLFGGYSSASAQLAGVEIYVGPPVYGYGPAPYVQTGPVYGYYGYGDPDVVTYPRRIRCGSHRYWDGNHCADLDSMGVGQP